MTDRRETPFDRIFGGTDAQRLWFPEFVLEADARGVDPSDPHRFTMLASVGARIRELRGDSEVPGAAVEQYAALLFHAFQFSRFGGRVYRLAEAAMRPLLSDDLEIGTWTLTPPHPAAYLQLPSHLVWARVDEGATPEAVDGFFWSMVGADDPARPPHQRLDILLALGMHPNRPGLSVIATEVALPGQEAGHFADVAARPAGNDFANVLPGGEMRGLHALVNEAEVLKLVSRVFWQAAAHPATVAHAGDAVYDVLAHTRVHG